jgi:hypothetical protein
LPSDRCLSQIIYPKLSIFKNLCYGYRLTKMRTGRVESLKIAGIVAEFLIINQL